MKKIFRSSAAVLLVLAFACFAFGDDFKSETFTGTTGPIRVHGNQFMVIRNFTQEGGSDRGYVTVTQLSTGETAKVLTAAIIDTTTSPPDIINDIVIAGPADVSATCGSGATACFISFKKKDN